MTNETNPIPRVTRDDSAAHSGDLAAGNIDTLKTLFPAIITDGKIDFDVLRQLLGDAVEEGAERYGLNWKGKARARAFALTPSLGTLRPAKDDSKDWDTTNNIVIEGDNLEVLKLLRKSYSGKVKLVYIDPPYNTGKDFVYPDNYTESLANYEALTGQRDAEGVRLNSNKETSGRYHTNWLNMLYPRLILAKELIAENGYILCSIDYRELKNTISILDDVFGEFNRINIFSWVKTSTPPGLSKKTKNIAEYICCYQKSSLNTGLKGIEKPVQSANTLLNQPNAVSELLFPAGTVTGIADRTITAGNYGSDSYDITLLDDITIADGLIIEPFRLRGRFRWSQHYLNAQIASGTKIRIATAQLLPSYEKDSYGREAMPNLIDKAVGVGTNEQASAELEALMGESIFSFPKPVSLLKYLVSGSVEANECVLDFFAGSGTTGHAVMAQNALDKGNRRYILVQLPEVLDAANAEQEAAAEFCDEIGKSRTIAELTKERLRRAGEKVMADHPDAEIDAGFRVYKLAASNLKPWQPSDDLAADLLDAASNVLPDRSEDDLLVELLLKTGIDLALPGETRIIAGCTVHSLGGGALIVCLADVPTAQARALGDGIADWLDELAPPAPTTFFFKDSGFDAGGNRAAEARANLAATLRQRRGGDAIEKLGAV